jgi:hypothetical protein
VTILDRKISNGDFDDLRLARFRRLSAPIGRFLIQKSDDGDFLKTVAEAALQRIMDYDVENLIGAAPHERSPDRQTYRNGYREQTYETTGRLRASVAGDLPRVSRAIRTVPRETARTRRACGIRTP